LSAGEERTLRASGNPETLYLQILSATSATLHWKPSAIRTKHHLPDTPSSRVYKDVRLVEGNAGALRDFAEYLKERASETTGMSPSDARMYRYQSCMALSEAARIERASTRDSWARRSISTLSGSGRVRLTLERRINPTPRHQSASTVCRMKVPNCTAV
jgi:hypothetical protein